MHSLQSALENALAEVPHKLAAGLVVKKLRNQGITLSSREVRLLQAHLKGDHQEPFTLQRRSRKHQEVNLEIEESEIQELVGRLDKFMTKDFPEILEGLVIQLSKPILAELKRQWATESTLQREELSGFHKRLERRWRSPLGKLRMLITISREFGANINNALRAAADSDRMHVTEVLTCCHARACQITEEIVSLLSSGFSDGAMARWRTLHEIAVVGMFIQSRGEGVATRYLEHQIVESYRAAIEYRKWQDKMGFQRISDKEFAKIEKSHSGVVEKFGRPFGTPYGWAAEELQNPNPKFVDIERAVGVDHFRTYYRMASHNVHANPKGVFFRLGLIAEVPVLLSGPSNAGLADPGHSAAISLVQVSTALGLLLPSVDNLIAARIMVSLQGEIGRAFLAAHDRLESDEKRWQGKMSAGRVQLIHEP